MKKEERKILSLFAFDYELKFSEIEKSLGIRSNRLAYYLKTLLHEGLLEKRGDSYKLGESAEHLIPYLSEKNYVLSVILVHIGDNGKCFFHRRNKRPFKDLLSLPGGRILTGESISEATERLMKEKFNVNAKFTGTHSVSIEHLKRNGKIIYTYLLVFASAKTKDKIELVDIVGNRKRIITSDYTLLKEDLGKRIDIKTIDTIKI
jgi:ADP-ribose pyrophosphatase YjhB (NUDIX family)